MVSFWCSLLCDTDVLATDRQRGFRQAQEHVGSSSILGKTY